MDHKGTSPQQTVRHLPGKNIVQVKYLKLTLSLKEVDNCYKRKYPDVACEFAQTDTNEPKCFVFKRSYFDYFLTKLQPPRSQSSNLQVIDIIDKQITKYGKVDS